MLNLRPETSDSEVEVRDFYRCVNQFLICKSLRKYVFIFSGSREE